MDFQKICGGHFWCHCYRQNLFRFCFLDYSQIMDIQQRSVLMYFMQRLKNPTHQPSLIIALKWTTEENKFCIQKDTTWREEIRKYPTLSLTKKDQTNSSKCFLLFFDAEERTFLQKMKKHFILFSKDIVNENFE